ncbi:hypothetical protein GGI25_005843 [Coemansia spiralis]|uniref:HMG box domain-containing protein n=2 Tax=Coemansia TaxID=4863 RepID=A0A9W8KUB1_9FUNG|nr:hypothetical protein EDC05_005896 [Coemansia umbellata]KAJ2619223.1 hypothetical protein GGI26_006011 [Coemansia sp. RSA 1358]KAJ2670459.1 hypothetical protein GGI25_005843 [Coemansia spiralis]
MRNHVLFPSATDQNVEHSASVSSTEYSRPASAVPSYPMTPLSSSSSVSQAGSGQASPQLPATSGVAPINAAAPDISQPFSRVESNLPPGFSFPFPVTYQKDCTVLIINENSEVMAQKVRQFCAADGTSFIEHVPGHCLVFIPSSLSLSFVMRELRKIRVPKPKAKPKEKSSKPTNAFIKYRSHKIAELKVMHPEISQTEISRIAGEFWKTEPEDVKNAFQKRYLQEKRIYDMNKAKRSRSESTAGSDAEDSHSDTQSTNSAYTAASSAAATDGAGAPGFGLSLGIGSDGCPIGFNTGRRRSHTLPPGGFSRSGAKRRISQELRKHLATKNSNAYYAALAANSNASSALDGMSTTAYSPSNGYISGSSISNSVTNNNGMFFGDSVMQPQQQPSYEFTFTAPHSELQIPSSSSSVAMGLSSPYLGDDASSIAMPLNPNFPMAEFASTSGPVASSHSMHGHTRSLINIANSVSFDNSVFPSISTDNHSGEFPSTSFVTSTNNLTRSLADSALTTSLPLIDTTNIAAFSNDSMSVDAFSAGYMSADATPLVSSACPLSLPPIYHPMLQSDQTQPQ